MDGSQENNAMVCKPRQISEDIDVSLTRTLEKCQSLAIPNEFLCPISMEIMSDPVIVSTGQTYDRSSIQKWLDSAHMTCPKTRETLSHCSLAPNYALRSLITQWCEKNAVELQKKEACIDMESTFIHRKEISAVVKKLSSSHLDVQRKAIQQIRMLSKDNPYNRILITNSGGIPPLVSLLRSRDLTIQEHIAATLFNLSIDEGNKKLIAKSGAIPAVIEVLRYGNVEARENSAATLFSLSMVDENKVLIGSLNGIPPLVVLLEKGTIRGKKDAATALFNLSHNQSNKARAVKAGIVTTLLQLLTDKNLGMVDEALSILLLLSSNPEGRNAIGKQKNIQILVELIKEGTAKNKECAIAVLLELGLNNSSHILAALQFGIYEHLIELSKSGTNRAQWKANSLLHHMSKSEQI